MVDKKEQEMEEDFIPEDITDSEDVEIEDVEAASSGKQKELREKLKACEKEKMAHLDALQRTKADFLNSKRRLEEQCARDVERVRERMIADVLPIADSFDGAMQDREVWERADEHWRKGVEAIYAQLQSFFRTHEVVVIGVMGERFDPQLHEAVSEQSVTKADDEGNVVAVVQKGYRKGETVIRHAKVIVGVHMEA